MNTNKQRCKWAYATSPHYTDYHDKEWGVPCKKDNKLFEFLILEGAQAGLSWATILNKREGYRKAFDQFDPDKIARYTEKKIKKLLQNPEIIRNRLKINAAIINAQKFLEIQVEFGKFSHYIWQFVGNKPLQNHWQTFAAIPVSTPESDTMSKDLKKRGFKFVGSTICYAYMQAMGMVNDHTTDCFRHRILNKP